MFSPPPPLTPSSLATSSSPSSSPNSVISSLSASPTATSPLARVQLAALNSPLLAITSPPPLTLSSVATSTSLSLGTMAPSRATVSSMELNSAHGILFWNGVTSLKSPNPPTPSTASVLTTRFSLVDSTDSIPGCALPSQPECFRLDEPEWFRLSRNGF